MEPSSPDSGPAIEYLLKEVSFSTCDNQFFGELEKEMLIPNNINLHGKIKGATTLRGYQLRVEFPGETILGYLKKPLYNSIEDNKRVLTYNLEELINFDDYWWFPTTGETEFSLGLNLLPPFPELNPVDLEISCRPDIAVGLEAYVTTRIRLGAREDIDNIFLKINAPLRVGPGVSIAISKYSDDEVREPRQSVVSPKKQFPFPRLSLKKGEALDYEVQTKIVSDPSSMLFLRCEQDILTTKLLTLSESTPSGLPCAVSVLDEAGHDIPVQKTVRSTLLQVTGQVMYSPFSVQRETVQQLRPTVVASPAY